MSEGRNSGGKFTKGHTGFKPKGAISRKTQKQEQFLNQMFAYFDANMVETLRALKPYQFMMFYININQLFTPKLKRVPYKQDPPQETEETEEIVEMQQKEVSKQKAEIAMIGINEKPKWIA